MREEIIFKENIFYKEKECDVCRGTGDSNYCMTSVYSKCWRCFGTGKIFEEIFVKRFKEIIDYSKDWIYFIGQQEDGIKFLYRININ